MIQLPREGEVLDGKYVLWHYVREGTMGAIARGIMLAGKLPVAVKFLRSVHLDSAEARKRFRREALAASVVVSDHVVRIYDVGITSRAVPYIVMEYLDGRDMAEVLEQDGRPGLAVGRTLDLIAQVLAGLDAAHAAGVVHRDVKLSNCVVVRPRTEAPEPAARARATRRRAGGELVKVVDFGISKLLVAEETLTKSHAQLGTPHYMAPEQASSPRGADARSDLFSVGVMAFRLLTGAFPSADALAKDGSRSVARALALARPDVSSALAACVERAVAVLPSARFASAREMAAALAAVR